MPKRNRSSVDGEVPSKRHHGSTSDDEDDEDEALEVNNLSQRSNMQNKRQQASEIGIIEEINLKNFMCHSKLTIKLCNYINYIIGRNGSGKSAVLTALVVGLGGKAATTNRGTAIKSFIKTGKQTGEVSVKLRNQGPDAYQQDRYGPSIIVTRTFRADGPSGYKLKDHNGRLVSTKREDLLHILDQFNIQVDNPLSVLNQDTSRNFLNSKSPLDRYKFFLRATLLEQLKNDHRLAVEQKEIAKEVILQKKESMPKMQHEVKQWEQKYKSLMSLDELRKKVDRLKQEMAWAQVFEFEKTLEPVQRDIEKEQNRSPKIDAKITECEAKLKVTVDRHKEIQEDLKKLGDEVQVLDPRHKVQKKQVETAKKARRDSQMELRKCHNNLKSCRNDREQIMQRINEIKNSAQQNFEEEKLLREEKISSIEQELQGLSQQQRTIQNDLEQFKAAVSRSKEESFRIKAEESEFSNRARQLQRELQDLVSSRTNRVKRFGNYMPQLLQRIEDEYNRGRFHQKPRGPIGANISLQDPKWALAVENCLKSLIHAFVCHDYHDENLLQKIFQETIRSGRKPMTITGRFVETPHDISRTRVRHQHPCVLDMLHIDDPVIYNTLVDQRGLENILLIKDSDEAKRLMANRPPANCKAAFVPDGDQLLCIPTYRYYSCAQEKANFLSANVEEDIRVRQEMLQQLEVDQGRVTQMKRDTDRAINENKQQAQKCETRLNKIRATMEKKSFEMNELRSVEDPTPIDVSTLEEDVEHVNEEIIKLESEEATVGGKLEELNTAVQAAEAEFKTSEDRKVEILEASQKQQQELNQVSGDVNMANRHVEHYVKKRKEHHTVMEKLQKDMAKLEKTLQEETAKAEEYCDKINTRRTPQNLESEISQILKRIKAEEKSHGDVEEIRTVYLQKLHTYDRIKKDVKGLQAFIERIDDALDKRQVSLLSFRRSISARARSWFIVMLHERNLSGKMTFDHSKQHLVLDVQTTKVDKDSANQGAHDMRQLSGGERSFATVCFILSLWQAIESPFRALDEYDIFMDMVNRRLSTDLMMQVCVQDKKQFIFLSPLDMSHLTGHMDKIRIFKMPDPERGLPLGEDEAQDEEESQTRSKKKR